MKVEYGKNVCFWIDYDLLKPVKLLFLDYYTVTYICFLPIFLPTNDVNGRIFF